MNIKEGWKTSEFWVSIITALCGVSIILGLFSTKDLSEFMTVTEKLVGILMALIPTVSYTSSRSNVKQNAVSQESLFEAAKEAVYELFDFNNEEDDENESTSKIDSETSSNDKDEVFFREED